MPQVQTQQQAAVGWQLLSDDPLQLILTYVPVYECRRLGSVSKALRAMASSTTLSRIRFSERYTLRGDTHGVVHALATAYGTREWPTEDVKSGLDQTPETINRMPWRWINDDNDARLAHGLVDPILDEERDEVLSKGSECSLAPDSLVLYTLPFQFVLSHFRLAFGCCWAKGFRYWVLEAFDSGQEGWRVLYDSKGVSPWAHVHCHNYGGHEVFTVDAAWASSQFRIRLTNGPTDEQCMHIRGFELFGTVLPPWRID